MRHDEHLSALQPGARLHLYTIGAILGAGGFGITYKAVEDITGREVAIKEYLPTAFAVRDRNGSTVRPLSEGAAKDFEWGLERFRQEAKLLIELRHPNIMPVLAYFEANATGYLVMEFQNGETLGDLLQAKGVLSEAELRAIVVPLLAGIEEVHRHDFLHRDLKPDNIFVRRDGTPVLIDFGAARQALGEHSKALTTLLTEGYAPFEQYAGTGNQGPWSDIYALAAVMFRCIMGKPPAEAPRRAVAKLRGERDPMAPDLQALRGSVSSDLAFAIEAGLRVVEQERPQSIAAFRDLIATPGPATVRLAPPPPVAETAPAPTLIPDVARRIAASTRPTRSTLPTQRRVEPRGPRRLARFAALGVVAVAAASGAAYVGDQRNWLPAAFRQAGSDTAGAAKPDAAQPKSPKDAAEAARRRAERRAFEESKNKALAEYQRRQIEAIEAERRYYFEAKKAEAEKRRLEEERARSGTDPRPREDNTASPDNREPAEDRARGDAERRRFEDERARLESERARRLPPDPGQRNPPAARRYDSWPPTAPGMPPNQRPNRPSPGPAPPTLRPPTYEEY